MAIWNFRSKSPWGPVWAVPGVLGVPEPVWAAWAAFPGVLGVPETVQVVVLNFRPKTTQEPQEPQDDPRRPRTFRSRVEKHLFRYIVVFEDYDQNLSKQMFSDAASERSGPSWVVLELLGLLELLELLGLLGRKFQTATWTVSRTPRTPRKAA